MNQNTPILVILAFALSCKAQNKDNFGYIPDELPALASNTGIPTNTLPSYRDVQDKLNQVLSGPTGGKCDTTTFDTPTRTNSDRKHKCDIPNYSSEWVRQCKALYNSEIPHDALDYTLDVLYANSEEFKMNKCYRMMDKNHYSMAGVGRNQFEEKMKEGIPNKCNIVINDTRLKQSHLRGTMFYIDLCADNGPKITKSYFNMGEGTYKNKFANQSNKKTTVLGAFLTNHKVFDYQPSNKKYKKLRKEIRGLSGKEYAPAVQLIGLQNTNNRASEDAKYMHVSPYWSSYGCPSIAADKYWIIENLAKNGPSLVVNYGEPSKMEDPLKCSQE